MYFKGAVWVVFGIPVLPTTIVCSCTLLCTVGRTQLVDKEPEKDIPFGWYDVGDGLYNPENRVVYSYSNKFLRNAGVCTQIAYTQSMDI